MSGDVDVSGLVGADMTDNQLDSGDVQTPTVAAVVQDTGIMDVTLPQKGGEGNEIVAEKGALPQTGMMEAPNRNVVQKEREAVVPTPEGKGELMEAQHGNCQSSEKYTKQCHQAAQTELATNCARTHAALHGSMGDKSF